MLRKRSANWKTSADIGPHHQELQSHEDTYNYETSAESKLHPAMRKVAGRQEGAALLKNVAKVGVHLYAM